MIHAYSLTEACNWNPGSYRLLEPVRWETGTAVRVNVVSASKPKDKIQVDMSVGAFWSDDSFGTGEHVLLFLAPEKSASGVYRGGLIVSRAFFERFAQAGGDLKALSRIKELLKLPGAIQMHVCAFWKASRASEANITNPACNISHLVSQLYDLVAPTLSAEQTAIVNEWIENPRYSKNNIKLDYFLRIAPSLSGQKEVTYESILALFDRFFVGYEGLKHTLASALYHSRQAEKRGFVILLHGLPGTGKTSWGKVIAKAANLPLKFVSLSGTSSSVSLVGCESSYNESAPGNLAQFFRSVGSSETCILLNEVDKVTTRGDRADKDSNVGEVLLDLLDPERPCLRDAFLDAVPIDCSNTVFVLTANRIDNLPGELLNRCHLVLEVPPIKKHELLEVLRRQAEVLERQYNLFPNWIGASALEELMRYRSDFGCRDALSHLNMLAQSVVGTHECVTSARVKERVGKVVNPSGSAVVRYHLHEQEYSATQRKLILDLCCSRQSASNQSEQEKRALDLRLDYLTKLVPGGRHTFDPDTFFRVADSKLYGLQTGKEAIAAACYAANHSGLPAPILLCGPAGVGKTSLVEAIAHASGRAYVRLQMNGITEPEFIYGVPREKVAADAGHIVRGLAGAETAAALLYFDELDKCSHVTSQSLLSVFDDSRRLHDLFLDCTVDLSSTLMIASANDLSEIDPVLLSRFQIIPVGGYAPDEKRVIAERHLLPELQAKFDVRFDHKAVDAVLRRFECDVGIRSLKHGLQAVAEKCLLKYRGLEWPICACVEDVDEILGPTPYTYMAASSRAGCVNGLAVAGNAKGIVAPVSVIGLHNGMRRVTGLAEGSVQDSVQIAETWLEESFGYSLINGFHIHFIPGGIEKQGASAGAAIAIAMLSALSGIPVNGKVAFTGEFDGFNILPVGGVPLKVQAAQCAGLETVYVPNGNRRDMDLSKFNIKVVFVDTMDELVREVFQDRLTQSDCRLKLAI